MKHKSLFILTTNLFFINATMACTDPCAAKGSGLQSYYDGTTSLGTFKCLCTWTCQAWNSSSNSCVGAPSNACQSPRSDSHYTVKNPNPNFNYIANQKACKPAITVCEAVCKPGCKTCIA